ncbi:hypothetical protein QV06_09375 [Gallibacterium genomosp. 3]|uniref:Uncharacterized protein n=1 Tax=Gallibacterium genomosp. 3 TaxID=505345 RepID=A0A1A7PQ56_9PAST|nr:hypothetical protein [Gallibacterium genomosp. 3]OBX03847.1 hypothetical protein QV06_09375 [Gallibacterium genomosp. 3]
MKKEIKNKLDINKYINARKNIEDLDKILKEYHIQEEENTKAAANETLKILKNLSEKENCSYWITLGLLIIFSLLPVELSFWYGYKYDLDTVIKAFSEISSLSPFIISPIIIIFFTLLIYLIKLHSAVNKIRHDYKFKYNTFKLFLYSHNWIDTKINNEEDKKQAQKTIITDLMKTLSDNPTRLISNQNNELPVEQIISAVKDAVNSKSK